MVVVGFFCQKPKKTPAKETSERLGENQGHVATRSCEGFVNVGPLPSTPKCNCVTAVCVCVCPSAPWNWFLSVP